jgi:hypothetical protein
MISAFSFISSAFACAACSCAFFLPSSLQPGKKQITEVRRQRTEKEDAQHALRQLSTDGSPSVFRRPSPVVRCLFLYVAITFEYRHLLVENHSG